MRRTWPILLVLALILALVPYTPVAAANPTIDLQVDAGTDDGHELESSGTTTITYDWSWYWSSTAASGRIWTGLRWESASLPRQGATIVAAYIQIYVDLADYDDFNGNWHFQKAESPATFTGGGGTYDITSRTRTTASTSWVVDSTGEGWIQTPSLVSALQEVVDSYSPTALVAIFRPNQDAVKQGAALTYEYTGHLQGAKLHIEYIPPPPEAITQAATNIASTAARLNGKISDDGGSDCEARFRYGEVIQYDDFEWGVDGDPLSDDGGGVDWTISVAGTSKAEIDTAQYHAGTRSGRLYRDGTNSPLAQIQSGALSDGHSVSVWVRKGDTAELQFFHGNGSYYIDVRYQADEDLVWFTDGPTEHDTGVNIVADTWTLLEIRNISWTSHTFDIYQNSDLAATGAGMRTGTTASGVSRFVNGGGTSEIGIDDVLITDWTTTAWQGGSYHTNDTYYYDASALTEATEYVFQTQARDSVSETEGAWSNYEFFTTCPAAPTNVSATDGDHTDKVVITWTKSTGATGYKVYRDGDLVDTLGDVATYDDTGATAPTITPGTASATDGTYTDKVTLSVAGESTGTTVHSYTVKAVNDSGDSPASTGDNGWRGVGALTYQWLVSAADSDADYSNIGGATTDPYDYTGAPAPTITPGSAVATDGIHTDKVSLSLSGTTANVGAGRYYKCYLSATGAASQYTTADRGHRGVGALTYQWQRSSGDADADYSNIDGATSSTYDDTNAPAGTITPGTADATDGTSPLQTSLSLSGASTSNGAGRYYKCVLNAEGAAEQTSAPDRGYRSVGPLTYQWQRSAADSDADYSNIDGATTTEYDDTAGPAPTVTPGTASAADEASADYVTLALTGEQGNNGAGRYYQCVLDATGAAQQISATNRGYRGTTTLTRQWQRSAADSDASYSNISGGTTDPYNDTGGVHSPDGRYYKCVVSMTGATPQTSTADRGCLVPVEIPTVTATNATAITGSSALLHGAITDTGYEDAGTIGFEWGLECGNYTWSWNTTGSYGVGTFTHTITGLTGLVQYFWRAFAINSAGQGNSTCLNFTTVALPLPPTDFTIELAGTNTICLTWTMGVGATTTVIWASEDGYPASITDGYLVYAGNDTSTCLTGLDLELTSYYYSARSWNEYGYSEDYATAGVGDPLGLPQIIFAVGLVGFALWKRDWLRILLAISIVMWGAFAMPYDIKVAAPLIAVGAVLIFIGAFRLVKARGDMEA